ncbi:MAG: ribosome maturation factor RimP [Endomicrobium sp.]|jgi:ribosome maturation factor RimP|uniref:ribosome maturation factor RimP n=1 Tax=Candidatus Endomicrobiellum cubanum TaxID=3242325 RepID=UPI00281A7AE9|nr:ribosome maturation factor RimP [Endomicrobium sp.]
MSKANEVEDLLNKNSIKDDIEIVDVQYVKENRDWVLKIFIDKDSGITMSDCEKFSYMFSEIVDKSNILQDSYILEVSSPGLNRVLKQEKSFKRFVGSKVRIQTHSSINNQKNFLGQLLNFKNGTVTIDDVTNGVVDINFVDIKKANLETEF